MWVGREEGKGRGEVGEVGESMEVSPERRGTRLNWKETMRIAVV